MNNRQQRVLYLIISTLMWGFALIVGYNSVLLQQVDNDLWKLGMSLTLAAIAAGTFFQKPEPRRIHRAIWIISLILVVIAAAIMLLLFIFKIPVL